jgi:hypothetical protein
MVEESAQPGTTRRTSGDLQVGDIPSRVILGDRALQEWISDPGKNGGLLGLAVTKV